MLFEVGTTPVMQATSPPEQPSTDSMEATSQPEQLRPSGTAPVQQTAATGGSSQPEEHRELSFEGGGDSREAVTALGGGVGEHWGRGSGTGGESG